MSMVGIRRISHPNHAEIDRAVEFLLDSVAARTTIPQQSSVLIKPNICWMKGPETGVSVDPVVARSVVDWLLRNVDPESIIIGEADATVLNADIAFKVLGWKKTFEGLSKVKLLNLSKDEKVKINVNGLLFKELHMSKTYIETDFLVSLAKLKTHSLTKISCILKNQMGALPLKKKAPLHKYLDRAIHDLNKARIPDLCIVDGLVGMEEYGPVSGVPKYVGVLVVGNDPVATDHACARIMGVDPRKVSHLRLAAERELGHQQYETFGDPICDVRTKFQIDRPLWKRVVLRGAERVLRFLPRQLDIEDLA